MLIFSYIVQVSVVDTVGKPIRNVVIYVEGKDSVIAESGNVWRIGYGIGNTIFHIFVPGYKSVSETLRICRDTSIIFVLKRLIYTTEKVEVISTPIYSTSGQIKITNKLMLQTASPIIPDPLRALINLPFVEVYNEILPFALYVKGGLPGENAIFLEGFPLIFPFHYGFSTAIPVNSIDYYNFYTVSIPPEFSIKVSSAIDFHLRRDKIDEFFVDPTSSVTFLHSRRNYLLSFRFTSFSLPLYYLFDKSLFYSFLDVVQRYHDLIFYVSHDNSFDRETEKLEWKFSNIMCGYKWGLTKFYVTMGEYREKSLEKPYSSNFFRDLKVGFSSKSKNLVPGANIIFTDFVSHSDGDYWWNTTFKLWESDIWWNFKRYVTINGMVKFFWNTKMRWYFTPGVEWSYLWRERYLRVSIGSNVQPDVSTDDNLISIIPKHEVDVTRNHYLQVELGGDNYRLGAYFRYYPNEWFFLELARKERAFPDDTLWNIVTYDTLVSIEKIVMGMYASFYKSGNWWGIGGDLSYQYGFERMGKIKFQIPCSSVISTKLSPSLRFGKNVVSSLLLFRSSGYEPVFYDIQNDDLILYSKPRMRKMGIYFRLDLSYMRRIRVFGRDGRIVFGIFNLIGIKPEVSPVVGEDKNINFPIPSAAVWIRL